ncbi:hypothetical protein Q1M63_34135 [Sinorhizobium meliloti]|nr:hypothetical protein Q1M63_34135 [Sinorhizobium meliloti]
MALPDEENEASRTVPARIDRPPALLFRCRRHDMVYGVVVRKAKLQPVD